ncbi:MAG: hypothetical protein U0M06_04485 [Clostridia bacterium]|nr:hypothetical protein [Clostridia bacterium]
MDFSKENVKRKLKKLAKLIFNPRLILCLGIAWMITNGWCYIFTFCGMYFGITWMTAVGAAYASLLWLPFTPEKLLTVVIAIFLLRLIFPEDKNTLAVLREELAAAKNAFKRFRSGRKENKE